MNAKHGITVVGSYNTDLVAYTPRMPVKGETILGGPFFTGAGGKGANQAVAAARLGADVTLLAKLGTDAFGDQALANFQKERIRTDYVLRTGAAHTGVALILVDQQGENMIVVASGANHALTPDDIMVARPAFEHAAVALFQLESPLETVVRAARLARECGALVMLNPAPGQPLPQDLVEMVNVLTPNQTETEIITGMPAGTIDEARLAAQSLLSKGVGTVVVTLGADGALVVTSGCAEHVPAYRVDVVDTTGAGDAFSGALSVALAEKQPLLQAVTFANAAAALQVTKVGAAPAMPYRDDVRALLERSR